MQLVHIFRGQALHGQMFHSLVVCLCLWAFAGSALAQEDTTEGPYTLQPGDTISVNVLEDPELDAQALVLPDGRVSLPVAGSVMARGRTPDQLSRLLRSKLRRNFVKPPTVTVAVTSIAETDEEEEDELFEVFVLGEVTRPGRYEYEAEAPITVIKALSLAGGLGPFAARARIQVREVTEEATAETVRVFDYQALEDGNGANSDDLAPLADGAVIVVPERGLFE